MNTVDRELEIAKEINTVDRQLERAKQINTVDRVKLPTIIIIITTRNDQRLQLPTKYLPNAKHRRQMQSNS